MMQQLRNRRTRKSIALTLILLMVIQVATPLSSYALTSGPAQPEFSSFEPATTVNMVNEFTGDFTYNLPLLEIPGPDGSGYPLSLSYHSGASLEEEASWVGYGWTLNPGAINRGKVGYPDDYRGEEVVEYNRVPANWTASLGATLGNLEIFGGDLNAGLNASIRYNNYTGFSYVAGMSVDVGGVATLGYSLSDGEGSFNFRINPGAFLEKDKKKFSEDYENIESVRKSDASKLQKGEIISKILNEISDKKAAEGMKRGRSSLGNLANLASKYGMLAIGKETRPTTLSSFVGATVDLTPSIQGNIPPLPIGLQFGLTGSYAVQKNIGVSAKNAFGYMYSGEANDPGNLMDYYSERESSYAKRDYNLATPFSAADNFMVSGEAIGGGFRLHNRRIGHFRPNSVFSATVKVPISLEIMVGADFGIGTDFGLGGSVLTTGAWDAEDFDFADSGDEPYYFRFNGDMGGSIEAGDDRAHRADIDLQLNLLAGDFLQYQPNTSSQDIPREINNGNRSRRSSYIGYHTNGEMLPNALGELDQTYTHDLLLLDNASIIDRTNLTDGLGEMMITNESGISHVFGLPVYNRNEASLRYLLRDVTAGQVTDNYLVHQELTKEEAPFVVGQERKAPYASTFLLTEIRMPDYVDRTLNGPTEDDFGGYTKFEYERILGGVDKVNSPDSFWYKWRMPYNGQYYDRGSMTDRKDDGGSVSYGEKEVYMLKKVETRTHYAEFITEDRDDGMDAHHIEANASALPGAQGQNKLKKLVRIELYRKVPNGSPELIKAINFDYDNFSYSTCNQIPNSVGGIGKLTLRRLWFEYEGTYNALINPYEFYYQYPRTDISNSAYDFPHQSPCQEYNSATGLPNYSTVDYPDRYDFLEDYGLGRDEVPPFDPTDLDAWGNYQKDGRYRRSLMQNWVNQNPSQYEAALGSYAFDPAAYQLKSITLPSGGEIHVQYEQDDYQFVQNRRAHALVSLQDVVPASPTDHQMDKFYLNLDELGINVNATPGMVQRDLIRDHIEKIYIVERKKMYFKFLYQLLGENPPSLGSCTSEYIDGYLGINAVGVETDVSSPNYQELYVQFGVSGGSPYKFPHQVCKDFVRTQRAGSMLPGGNCDASAGALDDNFGVEEVILQLLGWVTGFDPGKSCVKMDNSLSYLRIPVAENKYGGGIRVKNILMFDRGMESQSETINDFGHPKRPDRSLFGTSYEYKNVDGGSSGVATREPASNAAEDPLVEPVARGEQSWLNKVIAGKDKKEIEGPIGDHVIEPASVGYSRIVSKSIHSGATNPGYTVNEYFTTFVFPYDRIYNAIDSDKAHAYTDLESKRFPIPPLPIGLVDFSVDNRWVSQGYRFVKYDINGKPKRMSAYIGDYSDTSTPENSQLVSSKEYQYYQPGESLPIMHGVDDIDQNGWYPGKETEIVVESREVNDISAMVTLESDVSLAFIFIPIAFLTNVPSFSYTERRMRTHVTSKVIRYPAIEKSTRTTHEGIESVTTHLAFNPDNGQPLLSRTSDAYHGLDLEQSPGHEGWYHSYAIPASQQYRDMGQKADNERLVLPNANNLTVLQKDNVNGQDILTIVPNGNPADACEALAGLTAGSRVRFSVTGGGSGIYTLGSPNGNMLPLLPSGFFSGTGDTGPGTLEILESGRTNQLSTMAGGFTTYGPQQSVTVIGPNPAVLAARGAIVTQLNNALQGVPSGGTNTASLSVAGCEFLNATSTDPGITLSSFNVSSGSGTAAFLEIGLVDWLTTANTPVCAATVPYFPGGQFELDPVSGEIVFRSNPDDCTPISLPCLRFCDTEAEVRSMPGVVVASAQTFDDDWTFETSIYGTGQAGANVYEAGERGNWRPLAGHQFRSEIIGGAEDYSPQNERTYDDAGVFTLELFNYQQTSANDPLKWLRLNTVTQYSPYGVALEERDILGIYSAAKFGYHQTVPYLVAGNARYDQVFFESFENEYTGNQVEDGMSIVSTRMKQDRAHSGSGSYSLRYPISLKPFLLNQEMYQKGFSIMCWVYDDDYSKNTIEGDLTAQGNTEPLNFEWLARTGEWNLYEAKITGPAGWGALLPGPTSANNPGIMVQPVIRSVGVGDQDDRIDDIRYQPLDARMTCYVYDVNTLRPACTFGDQHFGMYYQYDGEGQLRRKMVETERGMRTVQENEYHSPEKARIQ